MLKIISVNKSLNKTAHNLEYGYTTKGKETRRTENKQSKGFNGHVQRKP
jgi:hypothetical protein